jgi:hypothetical protein
VAWDSTQALAELRWGKLLDSLQRNIGVASEPGRLLEKMGSPSDVAFAESSLCRCGRFGPARSKEVHSELHEARKPVLHAPRHHSVIEHPVHVLPRVLLCAALVVMIDRSIPILTFRRSADQRPEDLYGGS